MWRQTRTISCFCHGLACLILFCANSHGQAPAAGAAFQLALQRSLSVSQGDSQLLDVLNSVAQDQAVAVLLDRRLDPEQLVGADLRRMRLRAFMENLAIQAEGGLSVVADTCYIGPASSIRKLRTLVALRDAELRRADSQFKQRLTELLKRRRVVWDDLAEPRKLIADIADSYQLQVSGLDLVPHDLWRSASLTNPNATEALLLVLIQFDLSFEWTADLQGIRIVAAPVTATIERVHTPKGLTLPAALSAIQEKFPELSVEPAEKTLVISATIEQHAALELLLGEQRPPAELSVRRPVVLANQRFTLQAREQRLDLLLETLQLDGVRIEFDPDTLAAAGIDLTQRVTLNLEQATIAQLCDALCQPTGLNYRIRNNAVLLEAGDQRPPTGATP